MEEVLVFFVCFVTKASKRPPAPGTHVSRVARAFARGSEGVRGSNREGKVEHGIVMLSCSTFLVVRASCVHTQIFAVRLHLYPKQYTKVRHFRGLEKIENKVSTVYAAC